MAWKRPECNTGACAEVQADQYGTVLIRNSRRPEEFVSFDSEEWSVFLKAVKKGEFDL